MQPTLQENLVLFEAYLRRDLSERSASTYTRVLRRALQRDEAAPDALLQDSKLRLSSKTVYLAALRQWALFTEDTELADRLRSPELRRSFKRELREGHADGRRRHAVQPFSEEEERKLRAVLDAWRDDPTKPPWLWPAISMMANLGLRAGVDLAWLSRKDVEDALANGVELTIVTKGSKERPLPAVLVLAELERLLSIKQKWKVLADLIISKEPGAGRLILNAYERIRRAVKDLAREAGLPESSVHTHRFRHSAANRLWAVTKDLTKVQAFLGHESVNTTLKYLKKDRTAEIGQDLLAAMRRS